LKTTTKAAAQKKPRAATKSKAASNRARTRPPSSRKAAAGKPKQSGEPAVKGPQTLVELMAQALAMEMEAAQRYADFADAMETHNNREVAALFRKMADIESKHAEQIMTAMEWTEPPAPASGKPKPSSRSLTRVNPSVGLIPACAQAAVSTLTPIRPLRPSSALARFFGFEPSKATLTPNSFASLSSSGKSAGTAEVTMVPISTAFAKANNCRRDPSSAAIESTR
jgi:hypothetical protein